MKKVLWILTTCLIAWSVHAEIRTWTSVAGTTLEAEFIKVRYDTVYLRTANGQTKQIPVSKLIQSDRTLIAELDNPFSGKKEETAEQAKAPESIIALFGKELRTSKKKKASTHELSGKTIGIYFSAHWCPPCRGFTPELVKFHNEMTQQGKPFEIVFVSSDRDKSAMYSYMREMDMPWLALPFGDEHKQSLSQKYNVSGIPKLVIIDAEGNLITENGRGDVSSKGADAFEKWVK